MRVEFAGLTFEDALRYQYKLEGADADWSEPGMERSVEYAQLTPGTYRFLVRALTGDGLESLQPAAVSFIAIPPVWRRWWFLTLASLVAGAMISAGYRYRVGHLLELERVRTRIATDLHDDIGASLSQIAIQSEVVRLKLTDEDPKIQQRLSEIADTSRELVDSMGEIVWAMQPGQDDHDDLATRMRHFASNIFSAREIEFHFQLLASEKRPELDAAARRQVFLIFKEAVNNIVRHADCSRAVIEFGAGAGLMTLKLRDNGRGIIPGAAGEGHGIPNMRRRAAALGGTIDMTPGADGGLVTTLSIPLARYRKHWWQRWLRT